MASTPGRRPHIRRWVAGLLVLALIASLAIRYTQEASAEPEQAPAEPPPLTLAEIRALLDEAERSGVEVLLAARGALTVAISERNPEWVEASELVAEGFLRWCTQEPRTASTAATAATRFAIGVLGRDGDVARARRLLERAWEHRENASYTCLLLAVTTAEVRRLDADYGGAMEALQYFEVKTTSPAWSKWQGNATLAELLPIYRGRYELARAKLEASLGKPVEVRDHIRRANRLLAGPANRYEGALAEVVEQELRGARLALRLDCIDCYCNLGSFTEAAKLAAEQPADHLLAPATRSILAVYRALAHSWGGATSAAERDEAEAVLATVAAGSVPGLQRLALRRLLEVDLERGALASAEARLQALRQLGVGASSNDTTLETELLLLRDTRDPTALLAQQQRQLEAFEELLAIWRRTPARSGGNGMLHYLERREVIGQLVHVTLAAAAASGRSEAETTREALEQMMRAQTQGVLARQLEAGDLAASTLMTSLRPRQGVVTFLPMRTSTLVFAVDAERVTCHRLPCTALTIRSDVERFVALLGEATSRIDHEEKQAAALASRLQKAGAALAEVLLPPEVRTRLEAWRDVTLVGTELLYGAVSGNADAGLANHVPIECLPWQDGQLLGERFAIDHNVSLPAWWLLSQRARPIDQESVLEVFGVLVGHAAPGTAAEAASPVRPEDRLGTEWSDRLRRSLPIGHEHMDEDCRLAAVRELAARDDHDATRVVVLLAHCDYAGDAARGSYVQMLDGRLDCEMAESLGSTAKPFADVLFLGGCKAAKGATRAGDSAANLGTALQLAGVTAVVQSRFDLPLWGTQEAIESAMRALADGASCAAAMQAARVVTRSGKDPLAPYRVGVMQVHGYGQPPLPR